MDYWFRLRHLQSVSARNLNISIKDLNCNYIFFALSTTDQDNLGYFYQSTKCDNLLNPFWENVDLSFDYIKKFSFLDSFLITFFLTKKNKNKILLEIKVYISGLVALSKLKTNRNDEDNQSFIFNFNGELYSFDSNDQQTNINPSVTEEISVKIKKKLYNLDAINKFLGFISDDHQQMLQDAIVRRRHLENQIYQYRNRICRSSQKKNKIIAIRSLIAAETKNRNAKLKKLADIETSVNTIKQKIERTLENQEKTEVDITKERSRMKHLREIYLKISNEYMLRMYQLIHELAKIFPITPTEWPNSTNSNDQRSSTITIRSTDKLSICNLHLPNSDKQIATSQDNSIFAALGMVCQLLSALSKIHDIPLRYPLTSEDPKIAIRDYIIDIDDNERSFLLVKSTAANFRLQYAIYLLNLNIVAIRGYFSLSTKSPDRTLWNINTLIECKNRDVDSASVDLGSSTNVPHSNPINSTNMTSSQNDVSDSPNCLSSSQLL